MMSGNDMTSLQARQAGRDVMMAFALLTRLPLRYPQFDPDTARPAAQAAWAYPIVGIAIGLITALAAGVAMAIGLPPAIAAALALASSIVVTGAMHEDGLADCADGFWGGWTPARRLEIMKDSQIGTYGVIALILTLVMRWYVIWQGAEAGQLLGVVLVAATVSRGAMVWVMYALPNARDGGLSRQTGRPEIRTFLVAGGLASTIALITLPGAFIWIALMACAVSFGVTTLSRAKINGQTGDVIGGCQQLVELAVLLVCLSHITE